MEKIAYQYVKYPNSPQIIVDNQMLLKFLGLPKFSQSRFYNQTPIVEIIHFILDYNSFKFREWLWD